MELDFEKENEAVANFVDDSGISPQQLEDKENRRKIFIATTRAISRKLFLSMTTTNCNVNSTQRRTCYHHSKAERLPNHFLNRYCPNHDGFKRWALVAVEAIEQSSLLVSVFPLIKKEVYCVNCVSCCIVTFKYFAVLLIL